MKKPVPYAAYEKRGEIIDRLKAENETLLTEVRLAFEAGYDYGYGRGVTGETVDIKYIAECFKDWSDNRDQVEQKT